MSDVAKEDVAKKLGAMFRTEDDAAQETFVLVAKKVLKYIAVPLLEQMRLVGEQRTKQPFILMDSACGGGVMAQELHAAHDKELLAKSSILCGDNAQAMVDIVKKRITDEGWINTEAQLVDAQDTKLPNDAYTHISLSLGLHIIPDPDKAIKEILRSLKPGGLFGGSTFPITNEGKFWMPDIKSAFDSFSFEAPCPNTIPLQVHDSGRWTDVDWVRQHLEELGLCDVEVHDLPGVYHCKSAEEFDKLFLMMLPWLLNTYWTEEQRAAHSIDEIKGLIKEHLIKKYNGGGWDITWNVMTFTGRRPE